MNILAILKGLVAAITAVFLGLTGTPPTTQPQQIAEVASSTAAVVQEVTAQATSTTPADIQQAYELGQAVGKLQATADKINSQPTTTMQENTIPGAPTGGAVQAPPSTPTPAATPAPVSQARIEIVSPIPGKGLGRDYVSSPEVKDESNYIELGAVLYDAAGDVVSTDKVTITATDGLQDAIEVGTGDVMTVWVGSDRRQVPVYSFHYEFHTPGDHTITFATDSGLTGAIVLTAK